MKTWVFKVGVMTYNELTGFYYSDSEQEAKAFASYWGGNYQRVINFPNDYFKVTIFK